MVRNLPARDRAVAIVIGNHQRGLPTSPRSLAALVEPGLNALAPLLPHALAYELEIEPARLRQQSPSTLAALWMLAAWRPIDAEELSDADGYDIQATITTGSTHAALSGCVLACDRRQLQIPIRGRLPGQRKSGLLDQPAPYRAIDVRVLDQALRGNGEMVTGQEPSAWFAERIAQAERVDLRDLQRAFPLSFELAERAQSAELASVLARRDPQPVRGAVPLESLARSAPPRRHVLAAIAVLPVLRTPTSHDDGSLRFPLVGQPGRVFALSPDGVWLREALTAT